MRIRARRRDADRAAPADATVGDVEQAIPECVHDGWVCSQIAFYKLGITGAPTSPPRSKS